MSDFLKADERFNGEDYSKKVFGAGEFESCVFINCDFQDANLSDVIFLECSFENCNLSNARLGQTGLRDIDFSKCKLWGLRFDDCNPFLFELRLQDCSLNFSIFSGVNLKKAQFHHCQFHEVDFADADLSESKFMECDLKGALFERTNLQMADLRTAINYRIDPDNNQLKQAKFSWPAAATLLDKYNISISS